MPGLPFGAAQSYDVPKDLRCYEHVLGIEFIEIDPDLPYPRSAAYRQVPAGAQMLIRRAVPEIDELSLDEVEARNLIAALDEAGLFDWQRVYKPSQGNFVITATEWRLEVTFDVPIAKRVSSFKSEGEDEFPDSFDDVVSLLLSQEQGSAPEQPPTAQSG